MTRQVHTAGPGTEDYRSSRFTATVDGDVPYVYGFSRTTEFGATGSWEAGDTVEESCFTYGADEDTTVVVSLVGGSITSAVLYPKALGITPTVAGGTATFTVTIANLRNPLRLEVNGDSANVLHIHPHGLKSAAPGGAVTYTAGGVTSVADGTSLLFPAGVWDLWDDLGGVKLPVGVGATIYLQEGAVVRGAFDFRQGTGDDRTAGTGIAVRGPGVVVGDYLANEDLPAGAFDEQIEYALFCNYVLGEAGSGNSLSECTFVQYPFHAMDTGAFNTITDAHCYNPWTNNSDGLRVIGDAAAANVGTITNCSTFTGDDSLIVESFSRHVTATNCLLASAYSAAINLGYQSSYIDYGWTTAINGCRIRAAAIYTLLSDGDEYGAAIQCWVDETIAGGAAGYGRYRVTIDDLAYEGSLIQAPLFNFQCKLNPWGAQNDQRGNIALFTLSDISVETTPTVRSRLLGYDAENTPHDMTFADITIGGTILTDTNWETFVEQNAYPYNLTIDDSAPPQGLNDPTFVVEDGTGLEDSNSYCTLAFADAYHANYGNPTTWTALTVAEKEDALRQATRIADDRYAHRWTGVRGSSEQALDWPRAYGTDSAGNEIDSATLPTKLKQWTARAALDHATGALAASEEEPTVLSESFSSASGASKSVTYTSPKRQDTAFVVLDRMLVSAGLISGGGPNVRVTR